MVPLLQVHVAQKDKQACVQRYDAAFTFFYGTWDAALAAGYTCTTFALSVNSSITASSTACCAAAALVCSKSCAH